MGFSLKSRHKRIFIFILGFITTMLLLQAGISYSFFKLKPRLLRYLNSTFGYKFYIGKISFSFLNGLHIKEAAVNDNLQDKPPIIVKDAFLSLKILPILLKRTLAIQISIDELSLSINKQKEGINLQIIFSDVYKRMPKIKTLPRILKNTIIVSARQAKCSYPGSPGLKNDMYFLFKNLKMKQESENFNFDATVELNYHLPEDTYISTLFKNKYLKQLVKCSVQGNINEEDLILNLILLKIGKDQLLGMGVNKGFAERNPNLNINFIPSVLSLQNIAFMKESLNAKGYALISAHLYGPMDNTKIGISGKLEYCDFYYYALLSQELYEIKNFSSEIEVRDNQIRLDNASLILNTLPLNMELNAIVSDQPNFSLQIALPEEFLVSQDIPLKKFEMMFNGKIKKSLVGDLKINVSYIRGGVDLGMRAYLKNINFDYSSPDEKNFTAETVELTKDNTLKTQKLTFGDLRAKIYIYKNGLKVKQINLSGYHANLNGELTLDTADKVSLRLIVNAQGLIVEALMPDISVSNKLLSGDMDVTLVFDNQQKEFLKGICYIENGNADLDLLATIVKLPPLKDTDFDTLDIFFSFTRNMISVKEVKLFSQNVLLNAFWNIDGSITGALDLKLASELLNQSPSFRRLIGLTKIKKPYIDFSFKLGGGSQAVRVMWMKGEFRDKIKSELPPWVKKRIENDLDKMIDSLSESD